MLPFLHQKEPYNQLVNKYISSTVPQYMFGMLKITIERVRSPTLLFVLGLLSGAFRQMLDHNAVSVWCVQSVGGSEKKRSDRTNRLPKHGLVPYSINGRHRDFFIPTYEADFTAIHRTLIKDFMLITFSCGMAMTGAQNRWKSFSLASDTSFCWAFSLRSMFISRLQQPKKKIHWCTVLGYFSD